MGLFSSKPKIKAEYDDLRTNVRNVRIEDGEIYVYFNGFHQHQLDSMARDKARKEYRETHSAFASFFHIVDTKAEKSRLAFRGEDILNLVVLQDTAEQIAPDAFRMKAYQDDTDYLYDSIDALEEDIDSLEGKIAETDDDKTEKNCEARIKEIETEIKNTREEISKKRDFLSGIRKRIKKGDPETLKQFREVTVYVTPMGLSLNEWERFTALPELNKKERSRHLSFNKISSRVHTVVLRSRNKGKDDDDKSDDYTYDLIAHVGPDLEFAVNGYFKPGSLKQIDDKSFSVVDYVTGEEKIYYIGYHEITDSPEEAWDQYHANPNNLHWYSLTKDKD